MNKTSWILLIVVILLIIVIVISPVKERDKPVIIYDTAFVDKEPYDSIKIEIKIKYKTIDSIRYETSKRLQNIDSISNDSAVKLFYKLVEGE